MKVLSEKEQAEKLAWLTVSPYLFAEIEQQIEVCDKAILRECAKSPGPDMAFISDLAADKRALIRLKGRFSIRSLPPKDA